MRLAPHPSRRRARTLCLPSETLRETRRDPRADDARMMRTPAKGRDAALRRCKCRDAHAAAHERCVDARGHERRPPCGWRVRVRRKDAPCSRLDASPVTPKGRAPRARVTCPASGCVE